MADPETPTVKQITSNLEALIFRRGFADLRPMPSTLIYRGPQRRVYRYRPVTSSAATRTTGRKGAGNRPAVRRGPGSLLPVLLVPPLAAPALCFDLRRNCSLVEFLVNAGHPTYIVDYGAIAFADRKLGIEHWVEAVIPDACRAVSQDSEGRAVHLVGWSLGGIMALLVAADEQASPLASVSMIASPFDIRQVPLVAPLRPLVNLTGGRGLTLAYRLLGGAPASVVQRAYELAAFEKYITKPIAVATNLGDRDFLAQIEAVDRFMSRMYAYPGRTFGQLYHWIFRANDLADGELDLSGRRIRLADVRVPVLSIAGRDDGIAPRAAVHHVARLVRNVELATVPGGHLGSLTGRAARTSTWPLLDSFLRRASRISRRA